ncbi:aminopeptidase [Dipsacomyces acuminosporus]|nr:aminopeptidase [Dipsacomyces acuminosporus]
MHALFADKAIQTTGAPSRPARLFHRSSAAGRGGILSTLLQTAKTKNPITSQWAGQPTQETHPHLIAEGEVTPGITAAEYEARRQKLISDMPKGSSAVIFGSRQFFVSPHVFHPYRQDSDFYYLTGWNEPDSVAVIQKNEYAKRGYTMTLFVNPKEPEKELWEGPRNGLEAAVSVFGADEARPVSEFTKHASKLLGGFKSDAASSASGGHIYADIDSEHGLVRSEQCKSFRKLLQRENLGSKIHRLTTLIQRLRLIKSPAEIQLMREANRVSAEGFKSIMQACRPGLCESALQGVFEFASQQALVDRSENGKEIVRDRSALTRPAYVPVFASGEHALCMHYVQNSAPTCDGDLILVDAGAEYASYASDVTRTFPVNGKFSPPQRDLYSALLSVQEQMIKLCHVSSGYSLNEIHRRSAQLLAAELKQIGFHASARDIDDHLYPHHISHYLGMDVHDTVDMTRSQQLKRNMVVTVEPGVYVPYDNRFPKAFQGIGIRIEDDVIVGQTESDIENLSTGSPKSIEDIETAMH